MFALIIIALLVFLLFLILFFLKCGILLSYNTETKNFSIHLKVLFLKFLVFPRKNTNKKQKKKKQENKSKKSSHYHKNKEPEKTKDKNNENKKNISDKAKGFSQFSEMLFIKLSELIPGFFGALSIEIKRFHIVIGGREDAANAAIAYGVVSAALETILALENQYKSKKFKTSEQLYVGVDYAYPDFYADFEILLNVSAMKVLLALYRAEDAYYSYKNNL